MRQKAGSRSKAIMGVPLALFKRSNQLQGTLHLNRNLIGFTPA
jgi:hypothetical protein